MILMGRWAVIAAISMTLLGLRQASAAEEGTHSHPVIRTSDGLLQKRLEEIHRRSALWREAVDQLRSTRRQVLVVTPDKVVVKDHPDAPGGERFDPTVIAAAAPMPGPDNRLETVLVVVNLPLLHTLYLEGAASPAGLHGDIDRILVHEVYGHAVPYLLAGNLSGRCPDPAPRERAVEACSIRRENAVREELRLGRRQDHGLDALLLARTRR